MTVTARKPGSCYVDAPDVTPEEHKRRGDAADALFQVMKRQIAGEATEVTEGAMWGTR